MSLPCPKCGGKSRCTDTRARDGYTYRRLKCIEGHGFSSVEVVVEDSRTGTPAINCLNDKFKSAAQREIRDKLSGLIGEGKEG